MKFLKALTTGAMLCASLAAASFPDAPAMKEAPSTEAVAVLAGGCFWGMEGVFEHVKGVTATQVGYAGGAAKTAHYEMVSDGNTGHAESLKVTYDPSKISYGQLLKIFFSVAHDPTTLNRQHNDVGTQYRSAIFYSDDEQKKVAEAYIRQLNDSHVFSSPVVTKVTALEGFYPAEEHHQKFLDRNPTHPYIMAMDLPLIEALKRTYPDIYKR